MAVYQGARLRAEAVPAAGARPRRARATSPAPVVTSQRVRPMGMLMAIIVGATMLGLVYLTQTLGSAATSTEIFLLEKDIARNATDTRTLQTEILRQAASNEVGLKAKKHKLKRLDDIVVLPAP